MIKNLKKVIVANLLLGVTLSAATLEVVNQMIANASTPEEKQLLLCEREATEIFKDPQECIKAATIPKERALYTPYITYEDYQAGMWYNAGVIYGNIGEPIEEAKMYKKALELSPNKTSAHLNIGFLYYQGSGVEMNKYKAYEHWSIAAKQGNVIAQRNLDILCRESPWACK